MIGLSSEAFGAIVAAVIAGTIAFLGLIISKEQKTSEFRQAWIDSLRKEISKLISHANAIEGLLQNLPLKHEGVLAFVHEDFIGANRAIASVRLRLNPSEPASVRVLNTIEAIETMFNTAVLNNVAPDVHALNTIERRLVDETASVLKDEWRRVKSGELAYQAAKYLAFALIVVAILYGAVIASHR